MATSSRQSALFGVQDWKRIYQTYREANFQSYDYETLRKSFIDYITQYYPETFNDFIESSEFVALLDVIAFMGQALAFRGDLNARENFIDTAERRDSVIKLANLVSYTPKRNLAAQGLLKISSISTTENLIDINGFNLSNTTVLWNDPANPNWQEQFNTIINSTLTNAQRVGRPGNTQNILGVRTDEYTMNIPGDQLPVAPFQAEIDGINTNFELVSSTSANSDTLYELPPAPSGEFNLLYRNDKLGFGSANTGFFFYFKQGSLLAYEFNFPEQIQNNFEPIDIANINNTDTWLYQLDADGEIQDRWNQTDNLFINANLQTSARKIFTVLSRTNDQVTYVFGDNVFGEIPVGQFRAYVRAGNALTYSISPSEMAGVVVNIDYISRVNRTETLTITLALQTTVNNALQRESIPEIKERAPARYYTQNRMVNGEDYTNFPFTLYNSIIKSKAVNRSSIGVSRNQDVLDPTGKYSSTNMFGSDGALYVSDVDITTTFSTLNINLAVEFLSQSLPVYLATPGVLQYYQQYFSRVSGLYTGVGSADGKVYWKRVTVTDRSSTGYFYIIDGVGDEVPVPVGITASTTNLGYISEGALLKFLAPSGKYFDENNRLQDGVPTTTNNGKSYIWVSATTIVGDGSNGGLGPLNNGSGPITVASFVPSTAYLDTTTGVYVPSTKAGSTGIIPSFDNTLSSDLVRLALDEIRLKTPQIYFAYDNTIINPELRWSLTTTAPVLPSLEMIRFTYNAFDDAYLVTIKNRVYYFGSVDQIRFLYETEKKIFDPKSGLTLTDYVNVLKSNYNPAFTMAPQLPTLGINYPLFVVGQKTESDGYPDDYAVEVSTVDINSSVAYDPDFFTTIVGTSGARYVFFKTVNVVDDLANIALLPADAVNYAYSTEEAIEAVKYEYTENTIFYATSEDTFYESVVVPATNPPIINLVELTGYTVYEGRNTIAFQYRHNSNNTTRIDPGTTNIIDLYLVTESYYVQYQNWLNDTTGTIPEPSRPTINELQQSYSNLDNFKMISDSVILNSVVFKPLFGPKALPALQGTIKVIKSPATTVSDSQIRSSVLAALNSYFTIDKWNFGDTFYFSELTAYLHVQLAGLISSVVLVPKDPSSKFGDLYEIRCAPNEIFVNAATISDNIVVVSALTPSNLQM
jgi:hypothetical protein